jgi:hypothetical protein
LRLCRGEFRGFGLGADDFQKVEQLDTRLYKLNSRAVATDTPTHDIRNILCSRPSRAKLDLLHPVCEGYERKLDRAGHGRHDDVP